MSIVKVEKWDQGLVAVAAGCDRTLATDFKLCSHKTTRDFLVGHLTSFAGSGFEV